MLVYVRDVSLYYMRTGVANAHARVQVDYTARGELATRQQALGQLLHTVHRMVQPLWPPISRRLNTHF